MTPSLRRWLPPSASPMLRIDKVPGMPLVSIITPSWNVERLIGETIESVQAQTFGDWELLIADDCSTDQTPAIVSRYAASRSADQADPSAPQWRAGARPPGRDRPRARGAISPFSTATTCGCPPSSSGSSPSRRAPARAAQLHRLSPDRRDGRGDRSADPVPESLTYEQLLKNTVDRHPDRAGRPRHWPARSR